jgi:SAM-dependent methyltransferase
MPLWKRVRGDRAIDAAARQVIGATQQQHDALLTQVRAELKQHQLESIETSQEIGAELAAIKSLAHEWESHPSRNKRINRQIRRALSEAGLTSGRVLEIGARKRPRLDVFPIPDWEYSVMDIADVTADVPVVIGDITSCPEIPDGSFDVGVSVDVFEHINRPWLAASEISRILRPGGISYTSTLFSWRYHPVPIDYWRYTPACLEFLFDDLDCLTATFDTVERRRDTRGKGRHDAIAVDALGGWRENWRVNHVGRKPLGPDQHFGVG